MKHVSRASIDKAIAIVDNLNDEQLEIITQKYTSEQAILFDYVISAALEYQNDDLDGLIVYYFCLINESFSQEGISLKPITEEDIDEVHEPFFDMLDEYFETENEEILESFCDQPHLAQFMAMEVSTDDEDGSSFDEETATQLFIVTLSMITLMNRAIV
jgi:hypothetical protein